MLVPNWLEVGNNSFLDQFSLLPKEALNLKYSITKIVFSDGGRAKSWQMWKIGCPGLAKAQTRTLILILSLLNFFFSSDHPSYEKYNEEI